MNDENLELLSAYLDGALPEAERAALEARISASAEMRAALEDLRAVSKAVKGLPKEPLPPAFLTRLSARRARGDAPRLDWVFLPPGVRPVVAAMSCGVVALVIWSKVAVPPEPEPVHSASEAKVFKAADAPVSQIDLSRQVLSPGAAGGDAASLGIVGAASRASGGPSSGVALDSGKAMSAPAVAAVRGAAAKSASGRPLEPQVAAAGAGEMVLTDRTRQTMTEEERSARNEEMFGQLENQKKRMGLKVLPKLERPEGPSVAAMLGMPLAAPAAPMIRNASPTLLKDSRAGGSAPGALLPGQDSTGAAPGRLSADAALVFSDAASFASSWVLLGMPGAAPVADFTSSRIVMLKPSATKILSITPGKNAISVVYRSLLPEETSDPARDRVAPLPLEPKAVLIYDASPR